MGMVTLSRTAEKVRRSLDRATRKQVEKSLASLEAGDFSRLRVGRLAQLGPGVYGIRASHKYRIVADRIGGRWVIRDIVSRGDKSVYHTE